MSENDDEPMTAEEAERAQRKAEKSGRARERAAFLETRKGSFDQRLLDEAMERYRARAAPTASSSRAAGSPRINCSS